MNTIPTDQKIIAAAREVLEHESADAVTMRRIATAVGVTPMAIYRHFPDRESLLNAVADAGFMELSASIKDRKFHGNLEARLIQILDIYLDHALANPHLFDLMFLTPREGARIYPQDFKARHSPTATMAADMIEAAMADGRLEKHDVWEVVFEMGALSHGLIMLFLGGRVDMTPDQFRSFYHRSFRRYLHGILA